MTAVMQGLKVRDPEVDQLGPAMLSCTPLERRFVLAYCEIGGRSLTEALAMAGSECSSQESLRANSWIMSQRTRVREAMKEVAIHAMNSYSVKAQATIYELMGSRDEKVRLKAALAVQDRTGMGIIQKMEVTHRDVSKTDDELVRRFVSYVQQSPELMSMVPEPLRPEVMKQLTKSKPMSEVLTGEFEVVEPDPDADILGD
jgi:hypothetical protein